MVKTVGTTGTFSTPQLWEDGAPTLLTTAEKSACGTFAVATFVQGEALTFVGSGATGKLLDTDSTGVGTGTYMTYGITAGNPATSDVITGGTSTATCILTSGTPDHVGVIWQGQQQNQEFSGTGTQLNIGGSTASSTAYKEYTTVAGASFRDHANAQTNPLRYDATVGAAIRGTSASTNTISNQETFCRVSKLQVTATGATSRGFVANTTSQLSEFLLIEGTSTGAVDSDGAATFTGFTQTTRNCVVIQRATAADHIVGTGTGTAKIFVNCTFVAADDLATAPASVVRTGATGSLSFTNCGFFAGDSTKAVQAGTVVPTYTTCYTDTASPPAGVTQTTYSSEFQNVNDATRDFRLKTGAAQIDTGTTDATNAAIDIAGTARPSGVAYDVGAWEFVSVAQFVNVGWESTGQWL